MNRLLLILISIILTSQLFGQTEFETYKNGLIYSEETMNKLGSIVDSLNLKYKTCDLNKVFKSKSQTIGHIVRLDTNDIKQAKKDLDNNISFESFITKYPNSEIEKNVLIVKYKYQNYKNEEVVEFSEIDLNSSYGFEIQQTNQKELYNKKVKSTWLYDYNEKSEYSKESIRAFYFPKELEAKPLDLKYCRQIGYSDCLIDTLTTKFKNNTKSGWVELPKNWQKISSKKQKKLLEKMRSTKVVGGCSMDSRPREHAIHIALLSAETTNWEVFLKSHLDIMNDRFDRMSDGSYAWEKRKTYIKELEELDINVLDLLIGISLRIENPSTNHYYGSIGRLGRAISESKNKEQFEKQILSMIEDSELDDYNRVLSYFLFISYNNYLENEDEQKENLTQLEQSINTMPTYLNDKIKLDQK
ncbi:MAG: hypothetical protein COB15_10640 [Flavobacteriales bacterium]|nr:MAG: hypothetical protein COB15_10640 [Flavobacteriales bacterium]